MEESCSYAITEQRSWDFHTEVKNDPRVRKIKDIPYTYPEVNTPFAMTQELKEITPKCINLHKYKKKINKNHSINNIEGKIKVCTDM